jgi:hypothetical protein
MSYSWVFFEFLLLGSKGIFIVFIWFLCCCWLRHAEATLGWACLLAGIDALSPASYLLGLCFAARPFDGFVIQQNIVSGAIRIKTRKNLTKGLATPDINAYTLVNMIIFLS